MSTVYFLQVVPNGPIKIGSTTGDIEDRIVALQTGCPWKIKPLGFIEGEARHEFWLHRRFEKHRLEGEWFEPVDELLAAIAEILRQNFSWPEPEIAIDSEIRAIRNNLGESQIDFARRLHIDQATLSRWERKGIPGPLKTFAVRQLLAAISEENAA